MVEVKLDTPSFDDTGFEDLDAALALLGPEISLEFTFDDEASLFDFGTYGSYEVSGLSSSLGTGWTAPPNIYVNHDGTLQRYLYFRTVGSTSDTGYSLAFDFERSLMFALGHTPETDPFYINLCIEFAIDPCTKQISEYEDVEYLITLREASVPEPSTLAIFALGMIGLASRRFKKQ